MKDSPIEELVETLTRVMVITQRILKVEWQTAKGEQIDHRALPPLPLSPECDTRAPDRHVQESEKTKQDVCPAMSLPCKLDPTQDRRPLGIRVHGVSQMIIPIEKPSVRAEDDTVGPRQRRRESRAI